MVEAGKWYYLKENVTGADDDGCRVRMDVCDDGLNFCFEVADTAIVSRFRHDNEDIWQDDAVEVFVSPDGDRKKYLELEVSPYGVRFFGEVCNEDGKTPKLKKGRSDVFGKRGGNGRRVSGDDPYPVFVDERL